MTYNLFYQGDPQIFISQEEPGFSRQSRSLINLLGGGSQKTVKKLSKCKYCRMQECKVRLDAAIVRLVHRGCRAVCVGRRKKCLQSRALTWRVVAAGSCPGLSGIVSITWESWQEKLVFCFRKRDKLQRCRLCCIRVSPSFFLTVKVFLRKINKSLVGPFRVL